MLFASSRISVENDSVGPNAFEPKNDPACGELRHEVEVFILTGIRATAAKRRKKIHVPASWHKACNFIGLEPLVAAAMGCLGEKEKLQTSLCRKLICLTKYSVIPRSSSLLI